MVGTIHLCVTHRHRLIRDCLITALRDRFQVEATEDLDIEQLKGEGARAVVLLDAQLPNDHIRKLVEKLQVYADQCKVVLLVDDQLEHLPPNLLAVAIDGCVAESSSVVQLSSAIDLVLKGETFCSSELVPKMFHQLAKASALRDADNADDGIDLKVSTELATLTSRERQILKLISEHYSNKQIARQIGVSLYTVKNHVHHILEKLNVGTRFEAVDYARRQQWLDRFSMPH